MEISNLIWTLVGFFLTLLVFSYLFGDNALFRLATYLFVGVTAGYMTTLVIYHLLWPRIVLPLVNGTTSERIMAVIPLGLGILLLFKLFPSLSPVGSIPMAYLVGIGGALAVGGAVMGTVISQVKGTVALFVFSPAELQNGLVLRLLEGGLILIGAVATLVYFHFSATQRSEEVSRPRLIEIVSGVGKVFIAITLGAIFAGVYLSAVAALINRLDFLKDVVLMLIAL